MTGVQTCALPISRKRTIGVDERVRPDSRYGVSKAFGEALGSLYADKYGLRILSIRIGNVAERPVDVRRLGIWVSPRDLTQLVLIGLEHPELFGGQNSGAVAAKTLLGYLLGVEIHYFALVDLLGFVDIIDAIGGIDIYVPEDLYDPARSEEHNV